MDKKPISSPDAPAAIGPYSQAIVSGGFVFCSGQIPIDPDSGELVGDGDVRIQTEQVLDNLAAVLKAAGTRFDRAVKATIYLTNLDDFSAVNEVYAHRLGVLAPPARATVQVAGLPKGAKVEIEMIAALP